MNDTNQRIAALEREVAELKKQIADVDGLAAGYFQPLLLVVEALMREHPDRRERWMTLWAESSRKFHNPELRDPNEPLDSTEALTVQKSLHDLFQTLDQEPPND